MLSDKSLNKALKIMIKEEIRTGKSRAKLRLDYYLKGLNDGGRDIAKILRIAREEAKEELEREEA